MRSNLSGTEAERRRSELCHTRCDQRPGGGTPGALPPTHPQPTAGATTTGAAPIAGAAIASSTTTRATTGATARRHIILLGGRLQDTSAPPLLVTGGRGGHLPRQRQQQHVFRSCGRGHDRTWTCSVELPHQPRHPPRHGGKSQQWKRTGPPQVISCGALQLPFVPRASTDGGSWK